MIHTALDLCNGYVRSVGPYAVRREDKINGAIPDNVVGEVPHIPMSFVALAAGVFRVAILKIIVVETIRTHVHSACE